MSRLNYTYATLALQLCQTQSRLPNNIFLRLPPRCLKWNVLVLNISAILTLVADSSTISFQYTLLITAVFHLLCPNFPALVQAQKRILLPEPGRKLGSTLLRPGSRVRILARALTILH